MSLPTQLRLHNHLMKWDADIRAFGESVQFFGARKADLEHKRATIRAVARSEDPKITGVKLDDIVDADEDTYRLHLAFRASEGTVEAMRQRFKWYQAVADALRSEISTERAEAGLYSAPGSAT